MSQPVGQSVDPIQPEMICAAWNETPHRIALHERGHGARREDVWRRSTLQILVPLPPRVLEREDTLEPEDHERGDGVDSGDGEGRVEACADEEVARQHSRPEHRGVGDGTGDIEKQSGQTNPPPARRRAKPQRGRRSVGPPSEATATISSSRPRRAHARVFHRVFRTRRESAHARRIAADQDFRHDA
jgi:hypothetical protein